MTTTRPATTSDLPAIAAILVANDEAVDWPDRAGWPYLEHLLADARLPVAVDGDRVAGFAGSIEVGGPGTRLLTDLFVVTDRQERGTGRALLDVALAGADARMTNSSADPRALALYIRAGLRPWWPLLYLVAAARDLGRPDPGASGVAVTVGTAAGLSISWSGVDRRPAYGYFAGLPDAAGLAIHLDGAVAAVGWAHRARVGTGRTLAHLLIAPDADPVAATIAAWHATARDGGLVASHVPGPHPAASLLLERGGRITDRDQWCATDPALLDPARLLPSPSFL